MSKLNSLQELALIEINRLTGELREINDHMCQVYPPMEKEKQKEHNVYFASLPSKQTKLIRQIQKWSNALTDKLQ